MRTPTNFAFLCVRKDEKCNAIIMGVPNFPLFAGTGGRAWQVGPCRLVDCIAPWARSCPFLAEDFVALDERENRRQKIAD